MRVRELLEVRVNTTEVLERLTYAAMHIQSPAEVAAEMLKDCESVNKLVLKIITEHPEYVFEAACWNVALRAQNDDQDLIGAADTQHYVLFWGINDFFEAFHMETPDFVADRINSTRITPEMKAALRNVEQAMRRAGTWNEDYE